MTTNTTAAARIRELTLGTFVSQALSTMATLGIADELADGPLDVAELARRVQAQPEPLYRVLRALVDPGVLAEPAPRTFALTDIGAYLRKDAPGSMRPWAELVGTPFHREAWTGLLTTVRTGESAFEAIHGRPLFDYLRGDPEASRLFDAAMAATVSRRIPPLLEAYDFSDVSLLVDVGGGAGAVLEAILTANPRLTAILYDFPDVAERTARRFAEAGITRAACVGGDFFASVPTGGDLIMISRVIPDWDDPRATRILANCRRALAPNGRLILPETVFPEEGQSHRAKLGDLEMLVMTAGGRERTREQYDALLDGAGLRVSRLLPSGDSWVLEAVAR